MTIIAVVREMPIVVGASTSVLVVVVANGWRVGEPTDVLGALEGALDDAGEAIAVDANVLVVVTTVVGIDGDVTTLLVAVVVVVKLRSFAHTTHFGFAAKAVRLKQGMSATIGHFGSPQR